MIDFLKSVLDVVLRFLDWRKGTKRARERNEARRVVAEHDREGMNRLLQKRRDEGR